jgi:hypothetical protein
MQRRRISVLNSKKLLSDRTITDGGQIKVTCPLSAPSCMALLLYIALCLILERVSLLYSTVASSQRGYLE